MPRTVYVVGQSTGTPGSIGIPSVAVTGAPTAGQVLTATDPTDAAWQTATPGFTPTASCATNSTPTSASNIGTMTPLPWTSASPNTLGAWATGSNTKLTAPATGLYRAELTLEFIDPSGIAKAQNAAGYILKNAGATGIAGANVNDPSGSTNSLILYCGVTLALVAGDFLTAVAQGNTNTANGTVFTNTTCAASFCLTRLA